MDGCSISLAGCWLSVCTTKLLSWSVRGLLTWWVSVFYDGWVGGYDDYDRFVGDLAKLLLWSFD